jgi:D-glycero-beta-D-manno-heptose 1-phosphate adenylyltransferase
LIQEKIYHSISKLKQEINNRKIIMASGGFSILHVGHTRYILGAAELKKDDSVLVVVVNGDGWLERKKGFIPVTELERAEIIASLSGVDFVLIWDDGTPTVSGAIDYLKPVIFAKGGDRSGFENVPEYNICEKIQCQVLFDVGAGGKIQSSSNIISNIENNLNKR